MLKHQHPVQRMENGTPVHDDTERAMADSDSKYQIVTGNFNAKIGAKTKNKFISMGTNGIRERNERGDRLIEFAEEHKVIRAQCDIQKPQTDTELGSHQMGKQQTRLIVH